MNVITAINDNSETWLATQISRAKYDRSVQLGVKLTPALARAALERNTHNRTINRNAVKTFIGIIGRGEWCHTHQGIAFDRNGKLHDGQHRCLAVIETEIAVITDVHFGVDPDTFDRIDVGKNRSIANVLEIAGHKHAKLLGGMSRCLASIEKGVRHAHSDQQWSLTKHAVIDFIIERPDMIVSAELAHSFKATLKRTGSISGIGAAIFLMRKRMGAHETAAFLDRVKSGVGYKTEDDPACRLRNKLMVGIDTGQVETAATFIKAFNAYLDGREMRLLKWSIVEGFPEVAV